MAEPAARRRVPDRLFRLPYNGDGEKDVLGLWIEQTEGAKFWLRVINELKARGVNDILIAVVDALKLLYLAIRNAGVHWRRPVEWTAAMGQFAIHFGARFPGTARS
jgi:transposase-like protein